MTACNLPVSIKVSTFVLEKDSGQKTPTLSPDVLEKEVTSSFVWIGQRAPYCPDFVAFKQKNNKIIK